MKKNKLNRLMALAALCITGAFALVTTGCDDTKSYAELLNEENKSVNWFLVDQRVVDAVPADTVFEVGEDAPYYCLDSENSIYMQVLEIGNGDRVEDGQKVYFRYMRVGLRDYRGVIYDEEWSGNANNVTGEATYFKYDDFTDEVSYKWGTGLQQPLKYLPLNSHVRIVIKSQYGPTDYLSSVIPILWDVRYFKSQI